MALSFNVQLSMSGFLYGIAVALIWGAQPVVAAFGYRASLTAFDLTLVCFAAAALQTLYRGVQVTVIWIFLFNLAVRRIGAKTSMFSAVMPIVGLSLAVAFLDEPLTYSLISGTVCIVAGLFLALRRRAGTSGSDKLVK